MSRERVPYLERTRALYASQAPYRWVHNDPITDPPPFTPIRLPLAETRVSLIASGGVHRCDQPPFHFHDDVSERAISLDSALEDLRVAHFGYDVTDARRDPGCVFPLAALRELAASGVIAELADPAWSFMGGIYSSRRVRSELAPRLRDLVLRQRADLAYLVPA